MTKWSLNNYKIRVTATYQERDFWIKKFNVNSNDFHVIPYNLDKNFSKFKETDILKQYGLKKKKYLLYIGRTGPNKFIQLLKDSYEKTSKQLPLVIAGKGTEIFGGLGSVSEDDKKMLIKNAYCTIFPSNYESFGIVLTESIALCTPTIGSNIPPFAELLSYDYLFENTIESLSTKIDNIIDNGIHLPRIELSDEKKNLYCIINWCFK